MDLKDDDKPLNLQQHPNITSRYFESNAGQLFVNNVNPFESAGSYGGDIKNNHINNDEFINLYDNTITKEPDNTPSKALLNELMKNYPFNGDLLMKDPYDEIHNAYISGNQRPYVKTNRPLSQPTLNLPTNLIDTQYITSCSRGAPKTTRYDQQVRFKEYNEDNNRQTVLASDETLTDPIYEENTRAEKTTYCRPLLNMYNQEFVYKTMQRNARLQRLVRKLVIAREREKQREAWNNYINDLKNKHRYYSNEPSRISPQYVPDEHRPDEFINDFYNTRYSWRQSNPCQHLLQDFYGAHSNMPPDAYNRYLHEYDSRQLSNDIPRLYDINPFCFPTSSQANLIKRSKEKPVNNYAPEWRNRPADRYFRGSTIVAQKERRGAIDKIQGTSRPYLKCTRSSSKCVCKNKMCTAIKSSSIPIQTENSLALVNEEDDKYESTPHKSESFKDKFKRVTSNIARLKNKIRRTEEQLEDPPEPLVKRPKPSEKRSEEDTRIKSLVHIEQKIDGLIKSINSIMIDIKSKKTLLTDRKCASVSCRFVSTSHNNLNRPKSDTYGLMKNEEYVCGIVQTSSRNLTLSEIGTSSLTRRRDASISKIDKILLEEMRKSNQVKRDIEELLNLRNDRSCSVQITFDIPTKEISTEVTDSLSKAKLESGTKVVVQEIPSADPTDRRHTQMTIAVNTDPLSLLALLRVSTETIKQLLSYMPNLNYNTYLSMLQTPTTNGVAHYICNICGAAFGRPSQLSDHIQEHNLGRTRDCCVCRHTLDVRQNRVCLFSCRYCGQRFTRAYCCELHQQTCARRLGRCHDVNSSHILLR